MRGIACLGKCSNRGFNGRGLGSRRQARGTNAHLIHHNSINGRKRLAGATHARPAVHSINLQREFRHFVFLPLPFNYFDDSCVNGIRT
jgi:hypothetical protein